MTRRYRQNRQKKLLKEANRMASELGEFDAIGLTPNELEAFIEDAVIGHQEHLEKKSIAQSNIQNYAVTIFEQFIDLNLFNEYLQVSDSYKRLEDEELDPLIGKTRRLRSGLFSAFKKEQLKKAEEAYADVCKIKADPLKSRIRHFQRQFADVVDEKIFRSEFVQWCIRELGAGVSLDWVKEDIWGRDLKEVKSKYKTRYSKLVLRYTDINDLRRHSTNLMHFCIAPKVGSRG